jgi:heme exporter protein A
VSAVPIEFDVARVTDHAEVVRATALCKSIDGRAVLDEVYLRIPAGSFVALLGANGAGKSTLLKVLATLSPPTSGRLELFGRRATATGRGAEQMRRSIGLIGHQSMLYRDLSARENLEFFGRLYGVPDPRGRAEWLLDAVGLLDRADDPVRGYSRGMTQRAALARALVHDPQLLLADEPFDGLDAPSAAALEGLLGVLHAGGRTLILANHDIAQSLRLAGRAVVLREGRVVIDEPARGLRATDVLAEMERGDGP